MDNSVRPTVIQLAPGQVVTSAVTFEEAFGDYSNFEDHSNLFGKLRARIAEKRAGNIERIQAAKRRIGAARTETKVARQQNKAQKRLARISKRQTAQQARIAKRKAAKAARHPADDTPVDDGTTDDQLQDTSSDTGYSGQADNGASLQDTGTDQSMDTGSPEDASSQDQAVDDGSDSEQQDVTDDNSQADTPDDTTDYFDGNGMEYYDAIGEEESGFDGNEAALEPHEYFTYINGEGEEVKARIRKPVREFARKIEWNKEKVSRLEGELQNTEDVGQRNHLSDQITHHKNRAMELESHLEGYAGMDGENDGVRTHESRAALREARKERMKVRRFSAGVKAAPKPKNLTEVEMGLNPKISHNRIEVPARETASAEGESSFNGEKIKLAVKKINWMGVGIGVGIAVVAIWGIRKFKLV